jgi:hypothetical protein
MSDIIEELNKCKGIFRLNGKVYFQPLPDLGRCYTLQDLELIVQEMKRLDALTPTPNTESE